DHRHAEQINSLAKLAEETKPQIRGQDIARAVAASSAFPPVFSPLRLLPRDAKHLLTDGGVYDNSGVAYIEHLYETEQWTEKAKRMVIVSDAGREFPPELGTEYQTLLALALRVTDTQGDRIADSDSAKARVFFERAHVPFLRLSIHDAIAPFPGLPHNH